MDVPDIFQTQKGIETFRWILQLILITGEERHNVVHILQVILYVHRVWARMKPTA